MAGAPLGGSSEVPAGEPASAEVFEALMGSVFDSVAVLRPVAVDGAVVDFSFEAVSADGAVAFGVPPEQLRGLRLRSVLPAVEELGLFPLLAGVLERSSPLTVDDLVYEFPEGDGQRPGEVLRYRLRVAPAGGLLVASWRDVTARHEAEARERMLSREAWLLSQHQADVVMHVTAGVVAWVSPSVLTHFGRDRDQVIGLSLEELFGAGGDALQLLVDQAQRDGSASQRLSFVMGAGVRWVDVSARRLLPGEGGGVVVAARLADSEVDALERLAEAQRLDPLTGVAARPVLSARLGGLLGGPARPGVLLVGVSHVPAVNEALSYAVGDEMLREVADRLVAWRGDRSLVGRVAGNEFAVLVPAAKSMADLVEQGSVLVDRVAGPCTASGVTVLVSVCAGAALAYPGWTAEEVLATAAAGLHEAQPSGAGSVRAADSSRRRATLESLTSLAAVPAAARGPVG